MNKINFKVLISVFLLSFSFIACGGDEKEEEDVTKTNHFLYEGTEHSLAKGFTLVYGEPAGFVGIYKIDLVLYSSSLNYNLLKGELSGKGNVILFEFFSSFETDLSGTYIFDNAGKDDDGTFVGGAPAIDYNFEGDELVPEEQYYNGGTLKIEKSGDMYKVTFDCTLKNGKKVTGCYKGIIQ